MPEPPDRLAPLHPGEVLREEFMAPLGLSAYAVAKVCHVPRTRIERITREEIGITADTALRLEKAFGSSASFWLGLQAAYDMETTRPRIAAEVEAIARLVAALTGPLDASSERETRERIGREHSC